MNRRDWLAIAGGTTLAFAGGASAFAAIRTDREEGPSKPETAPPREGQFLLGVAPPAQDLEVLEAMEGWLDRRHAVVGTFLDMGGAIDRVEGLVDGTIGRIWRRGHVPHVYWQPFFPDGDDPSGSVLRELHRGEWDDHLQAWADALLTWATDHSERDGRLYLNFAPEFNGDWSPWSPAVAAGDERDFVSMWRHVHDFVMDAGLDRDHVQWIWTLDNATRGVDRTACYPGDDYVDWCGVHGYNWSNWGGWSTPADLFGDTIAFIENLTDRPIALTEFACAAETADGGHDPQRKEAWLDDLVAYLHDRDIKLSLYFNIEAETDWPVFDVEPSAATATIDGTDYGVYPAYRSIAADDGVLGADPDHPRVLADEEFWGTF